MPRWSAERRAPSVIGRGTPLVMASRCAATRHVSRCGDPHRAPLGASPPRAARGTLSTAPPVRRKAVAAKPQNGQTGGAERWLRRRCTHRELKLKRQNRGAGGVAKGRCEDLKSLVENPSGQPPDHTSAICRAAAVPLDSSISAIRLPPYFMLRSSRPHGCG